jgi:hypothetical protein
MTELKYSNCRMTSCRQLTLKSCEINRILIFPNYSIIPYIQVHTHVISAKRLKTLRLISSDNRRFRIDKILIIIIRSSPLLLTFIYISLYGKVLSLSVRVSQNKKIIYLPKNRKRFHTWCSRKMNKPSLDLSKVPMI